MEEIANESHDRFPRIEEDLTRKIKVRTPKRFVPAEVPQPWIYFGYLSPGIALLAFFFQGLTGALVGFAAGTLTVALHFAAAKWLLPRREVGKVFGYLVLVLAAVVLPIPSLFLEGMVLALTRVQSYVLPIVTWTVSILIPLALAPMFLLDAERVKIEAQIVNENEQLAKELARFEQRLWVFKKRWLFMLHGTVQGALTAALTRLQTFTDSDPYQAGLVRVDLERVRMALQTPPSEDIDFAKAASDIKDAWEGVCGIRLSVDMRAERALTTSNQAAYCVNEIMKEAVGNAVRHGSATAIDIQITRTEEDSIDLRIQNNGTPVAKNWKRGIGSRMLDDITVDWSLKRVGKLTTLTARLPL